LTTSTTRTVPSPSIDAAQSWSAFTGAKTSQAFVQGWLDVVCTQFSHIHAAALLVKDQSGSHLVPAAVWPTAKQDLSHLNDTVERCLQQRRGLLEPVVNALPAITRLAYPIVVEDEIMGAVVVEMRADAATAMPLLQHLHWGLGWLVESFQRLTLQQALMQSKRLGSVTQALALALQARKLREILFEIANDTARRLECARVGIGMVDQESVTLKVLSDAAWLEKSSSLVKLYTAAMEEALDTREIQIHPGLVSQEVAQAVLPASFLPRHAQLLVSQNAQRVVSIPLIQGVQCVAIMTLEWHGEQECTTEKIAWLEAYGSLLATILEDKRQAEKGYLAKAYGAFKDVAAKLFGPRHLIWKTVTVLSMLLLAILVVVPMNYRVTAKAFLEGQTQRVAVAPFEGFISAAPVRAGDTVQTGQLMAQLDDRDLKVDLARWSSERDQYERKLREAMAAHEMSNVQVLDAQFKQADAQVKLATEKITRAKITAPYPGIVVSGDLSQMIGSPVETGKKLFEIAPLEQYRIVLQVDEKEIRHIEAAQSGQIVVSGVNDDPMPLTVTKVTPVATAQDGKNTFRVEASLNGDISPRLRPGMEGIGKVSVGSRSLWWIITHTFTDWLRLGLWNWLP
jgi:multidrug resistance efflux pump